MGMYNVHYALSLFLKDSWGFGLEYVKPKKTRPRDTTGVQLKGKSCRHANLHMNAIFSCDTFKNIKSISLNITGLIFTKICMYIQHPLMKETRNVIIFDYFYIKGS